MNCLDQILDQAKKQSINHERIDQQCQKCINGRLTVPTYSSVPVFSLTLLMIIGLFAVNELYQQYSFYQEVLASESSINMDTVNHLYVAALPLFE